MDAGRLNLLSPPVSSGRVLKPPCHNNLCSSCCIRIDVCIFFFFFFFTNIASQHSSYIHTNTANRVAIFESSHTLSTAIAYLCVIVPKHFLNDKSSVVGTLYALFAVPVPFTFPNVASIATSHPVGHVG